MTNLPIASGCQCGHDAEIPTLVAAELPHVIRHGAILGALDQLAPGASMILVAPHKPTPLLAQIQSFFAGEFSYEYLQEGPDDWHIKFTRA